MDKEIEQFKKDFSIYEDLSEVKFTRIKKENYKNQEQENSFGEKLCTIYTVNFSILHVHFCIKTLVFIYDNSSEVLKLDLSVEDAALEKEIVICRNFLQRHRNINSTFVTLKKLSRCYEARRLISEIVLKKEPRVCMQKNDQDGTLGIKYKNESPNIFFAIGWKIEWDIKNCDIVDVIEVYYNKFDVPEASSIKEDLESLTHPYLDFPMKLKIWKRLFSYLSKYDRKIQATVIISDNEQEDNVLVISDSEDERGQSDVMKHKRKKRRLHNEYNDVSSTPVINVAD